MSPSSFALCRILGNDLPPRHRPGQTWRNLQFILEHEPDLSGCRKAWVLNRICDPTEHRRLTELLAEHGQGVIDIPFVIQDYHRSGLAPVGDLRALRETPTPGEAVRHNKVLYVTNCNRARNIAIRAGQRTADWVLPLDGNCCFTPDGWRELAGKLAAVRSRGECYAVPMFRLLDNDDYWGFVPQGHPEAESQVVLGRDCSMSFNEQYRYGGNSKTELLRRLGYSVEEKGFGTFIRDDRYRCGYVLRLFSGVAEGEAGFTARIRLREHGIDALLARLDALLDDRPH